MVQNLTAVTILVIIASCVTGEATEDICPSSEASHPCSCQVSIYFIHKPIRRNVLDCLNVFQYSILEGILNRTADYKFGEIKINGSSLQYLPTELFEIKNLEVFSIVQTTLINLFDEKRSEESTVEQFHFQKVKLGRGMNWEIFSPLTKLKFLFFKDVVSLHINEDFVKYVPQSLTHLSIANSGIRKLHDESFAKLDNLLLLKVAFGKIQIIKRSMFPNNLISLILSNNRIHTIPNDLFDRMTSLRYIYLEENLITTISEDTFRQISKPDYNAILTGNPVKCDCKFKWILNKPKKSQYEGACAEPPPLNGKYFTDLSNIDFEHC